MVGSPLFLCDTPGKCQLCLHEQAYAPLQPVLSACRWHAAPFAVYQTENRMLYKFLFCCKLMIPGLKDLKIFVCRHCLSL